MIATLLSLALLGMFGGEMTAQEYLTFSPPASPAVVIETANGSINLKTGSGGIDVTATKKADSQAKLAALKVASSQNGSTITVRAVFPQACSDCGSVSFEVSVPAGAKVQLATTNGSITARGLAADSHLSTTNGSVTATYGSTSSVRAIAIETTNGSISLRLPSNAKIGRVHASTMVGHLSSDWNLNVDRTNYVGSNVDQTLQPGGTTIDLSTGNGSISLQKN
jgi:DUF4097 and DUF4098 domain-containing protein YvlB